jgi:hypothetical protein
MQVEEFFEVSRSLATNFRDGRASFHHGDSRLVAALEDR